MSVSRNADPSAGRVSSVGKSAPKPVGRPRDSNSERTKAVVISAAVDRFAHQGLARTTLRDVATAANLSSGTLYHYFSSKTDLYRDAYLWVLEDMFADMRLAIRGKQTIRARMAAVVDSSIRRTIAKPDSASFILRAWVEHNTEDQDELPTPDFVHEFYQQVIGDAVERGEVTPRGAAKLVDALRAMQWGISALAVTGRSPIDAADGLRELVREPFGAFGAEPDGDLEPS